MIDYRRCIQKYQTITIKNDIETLFGKSEQCYQIHPTREH